MLIKLRQVTQVMLEVLGFEGKGWGRGVGPGGGGHVGLAHSDSKSLNEMLIHTESKLSVYGSYWCSTYNTEYRALSQTFSRKFLHTNF